jgi:hypothetical protein
MAYSNFYAVFYDFLRSLRLSWQAVWRYYPNRIYIIVFFALSIISFWQAHYIFSNLSGDLLVFRYRINFGASLIGSPIKIFTYPAASLIVLFSNFIIAMLIRRRPKARFLFHLLFGSTTVFSLFIIIYLYSVFLINFR